MRILALLDSAAADGGNNGAPRAKTSTPPTNDGLDTAGISDALAHLDVPQGLKDKVIKLEQPPKGGTTPTAEQKAAAELTARATAAGRSVEEQKTFEAEEAAAAGKGGEIEAPQFSQDEQAWLDLRAAATTDEEIAELTKTQPDFSQEQIDWINAAADKAEAAREDSRPTEDAPEFTEEQKPYVTALTAERDELKTKFAEAESKRSELEAQVAELENAAPPIAGNLHPLALTDKPEDIDAHEESLEKFIAWGRQNWDGSDEVKDGAGKVTQRAYTASEIRDAVTRRESELRKLVPAARKELERRQADVAAAHKIYPAFADPKSADSKLAGGILKQYPVLKAMPNYMTIIGDAIAGERARVAAAAKVGKGFRIGPKVAPKVAPKAGAGGGGSRVVSKAKTAKGPDVKKFIEAKKTAPNETAALAATLGDGY